MSSFYPSPQQDLGAEIDKEMTMFGTLYKEPPVIFKGDRMIDKLEPNQFFVFGSNMWGKHSGGAALQAKEKFGAIEGIAEGLQGQSYAFPTLEREMTKRGIPAMERSRDRLYATARALPEKEFLLTPVGTGIAGYEYAVIEELFKDLPSNIKKVNWR